MRTRALAATLAIAMVGAVAGCSGGPTDPARPARAAAATVPSASPSAVLTPTAPAGTALGAGERVWAAFAQPGVPYKAWWARLAPLLSEAARAVYVYDDPRKIPPMTITGTIHVAADPPGEARYTAEVVVPTSKGEFGLDLERHRIGSPWLLYAIRFPPGVG